MNIFFSASALHDGTISNRVEALVVTMVTVTDEVSFIDRRFLVCKVKYTFEIRLWRLELGDAGFFGEKLAEEV